LSRSRTKVRQLFKTVFYWLSAGEMWVGITLAVVIEVVPVPLRTSAVAVYMFIISNIGGNVPLLVPLLKTAFHNLGYDSVSSLRGKAFYTLPQKTIA